MKMLAIVVLCTALLAVTQCRGPLIHATLDISYAPKTAMVINERGVQMFRAPLCKGDFVDEWVFDLRVYLMNVQWDSNQYGENNWLQIRIFNSEDKTKLVCTNVVDPVDGKAPLPSCGPFKYYKKTYGSGDMYIEITASSGTPTYQYGLNLMARDGAKYPGMNDVMSLSVDVPGTNRDLPLETLSQVALPYISHLVTGQTGQYQIPYCFEDNFSFRTIASTVLVEDNTDITDTTDSGAGGVASYLCTDAMMHNGECFRSIATRRGEEYFDASGAKVNTLFTKVSKNEYGPIHILILAQGDYQKRIDFTVTAKLRAPQPAMFGVNVDHETDVKNVLSYLSSQINTQKPYVLEIPDELKDEL